MDLQGCVLLGAGGENPLPCHFWLLEVACIHWLVGLIPTSASIVSSLTVTFLFPLIRAIWIIQNQLLPQDPNHLCKVPFAV